MNEKESKVGMFNQIKERERRVVKMKRYIDDANTRSIGIKKKQKLDNDKILLDIHDEFIKKQRQVIIEERKLIKEQQKIKDKKMKLEFEAKEFYYRDQIKLLEEELKEEKKKDLVALKAQQEELRRLGREAKQVRKDSLKKNRVKIEADVENSNSIEDDLWKLKQQTAFLIKKRS